ncbi:family 16 glycoside hydrolase [Adhaeribacter aquaticus]|uniref:family 16 glycoside hydrolase n=1 Tax=Adhaeribacter aquaticus TaxID=299567 RepID=UPI0003F621D2|nr:family 16 glycoside hydrolase [Adhaeribacter aquaticus]
MEIKNYPKLVCLLVCLFFAHYQSKSQSAALALTPVSLNDLSAFKPVTNNWKLVSDVFFDPIKGGAAKTTSGTGILVNTPSKNAEGHLLTTMEHGDLELELDFMMAKGSNAGVYLQGRYEIQMFDSWGVKDPKSSDAGGIYERWDESRPEGRKGYEGHPPAQNVSKAPGLWQHFRIVFRAPRFNAQGQKTENARFIEVVQNGVTIHKNVEVTGPTRAAAFQDEKPLGPLMIQGDHGSVAIRNIKYKAYGTELVTLSNLKLSAFDGTFKSVAEFDSKTPKTVMDLDVLAHLAPATRDNFAGKITGTIHVPTSGQYYFNLNLAWIPNEVNPERLNGTGELSVNGNKVLTVDPGKGSSAEATVNLQAGDYPITLSYYKNYGFWYARSNDITLSVAGPGVAYRSLNTPVRAADPVGPITVSVENEPVMQRGFVNHGDTKRTHVISVGEPGGASYTVDLHAGEFLQIWRGNFLETTQMWHGRGESQLAVPQGSVIQFPAKPSLTFLTNQKTAWPDSNAAFSYLGYDVTKAGRPIFKYALGAASVRETIEPEDGGKKLAHSFTVMPGQETKEIWCLVASGDNITKLPNGLYAVNDKQYFIELAGKEKPVIRTNAQNKTEMLLPVKVKNNMGMVKYAIVW